MNINVCVNAFQRNLLTGGIAVLSNLCESGCVNIQFSMLANLDILVGKFHRGPAFRRMTKCRFRH